MPLPTEPRPVTLVLFDAGVSSEGAEVECMAPPTVSESAVVPSAVDLRLFPNFVQSPIDDSAVERRRTSKVPLRFVSAVDLRRTSNHPAPAPASLALATPPFALSIDFTLMASARCHESSQDPSCYSYSIILRCSSSTFSVKRLLSLTYFFL